MNRILTPLAFVVFVLVLSSCAVNQVSSYQTKPYLIQQGKKNQQVQGCVVECEFNRVYRNNIEFKVDIINNSANRVLFDTANIFCSVDTLGTYRYDSLQVNLVNSDSMIADLKHRNKALLNGNNPYAPGETVGEIMTEALVTGTIAALFGMEYEELEKSNEENENNWNEQQMHAIRKINSEIEFWETEVLKPQFIRSNNSASGVLVFPLINNAATYEVNIKLYKSEFKFKFNQMYH